MLHEPMILNRGSASFAGCLVHRRCVAHIGSAACGTGPAVCEMFSLLDGPPIGFYGKKSYLEHTLSAQIVMPTLMQVSDIIEMWQAVAASVPSI